MTTHHGLTVYGRPIVDDYHHVDFDLGVKHHQVQRKKPMKLHSPKTRMGWQNEAATANYEASRGTTIHLDHQTKKEASPEPPGLHRAGAGGERFEEIRRKMTSTEMDKILEPSKEKFYFSKPVPACPSNESKEFYERNQRGTYGFMEKGRRPASVDAPKSRCPANETRENLEKGRGQAGGIIFQTNKVPEDVKGPRTLGSGAQENYSKNLGGAMTNLMNQSSNIKNKYSDVPPAPRAIKGERAEQNAQRNRGCAGQLFAEGGRGPTDFQPPAPRVRPEAREIAAKEGEGMRDVLFGGGKPDPKPAARVGLGADGNYKQGQGTLTQDIYNYKSIASDNKPAPRVRPEAEEISRSQQGIVTKNLFQKYGNLPGENQPKAHVPPRARGIARKSQGGEMASCINPVRNYEKKRLRHMRRAASAHG